MAQKYKWNWRRELRNIACWLRPETVDFKRDRPRRELEAELNKHEPHSLGFIAIDLEHMGRWDSHAGVYGVFRGDQAGWSHLRLALEYYGWELRINYGEYEQALSQGRQEDVSLTGLRQLVLTPLS